MTGPPNAPSSDDLQEPGSPAPHHPAKINSFAQARQRAARGWAVRWQGVAALTALLVQAGRGRALATIALATLQGLSETALIVATGWLTAAVSAGLGSKSGSSASTGITRGLAVLALVLGLLGISRVLVRYFARALTVEYTLAVRETVGRAAMSSREISQIMDPYIGQELSAVDIADSTGLHSRTIQALADAIAVRVSALSATVILFTFTWWAPLILAVGWIAMGRAFQMWMDRLEFGLAEGAQGPMRRAGYLWRLSVESPLSKELRVFGLADWLVARYAGAWASAMSTVYHVRRSTTRAVFAGTGALAVSHIVVLAYLGKTAVDGEISISRLTMYGLAVLSMYGLGSLGYSQTIITQSTANARRVMSLVHMLSRPEPAPARLSADPHGRNPVSLRSGVAGSAGISCQGVRFAYPGRAAPVLDGLDLCIPPGQSVAIVGENGAGKSTLIRVLCGLVTPQAGRVTIDGTDLGSIDLAAWRAQLAVVFQDFVRFHVSLAENVAFGRLGLSSDRMALTGALRRAGSQTLPGDLPFGWDTVLDSAYDRGTALSGGQWQRVALARAFLAIAGGAKILILDEPTAALDVRSERQVFERIADLSAEVTTILVSHRLSSVRQVDRIVFLADGKVVEDGSHEQLMLLNQKYAAMFRLQAERFERI